MKGVCPVGFVGLHVRTLQTHKIDYRSAAQCLEEEERGYFRPLFFFWNLLPCLLAYLARHTSSSSCSGRTQEEDILYMPKVGSSATGYPSLGIICLVPILVHMHYIIITTAYVRTAKTTCLPLHMHLSRSGFSPKPFDG